MSSPTAMTRWRDKPLVPEDYADLASLVKIAHKARGCIVEFDWIFTLDDLQHLRRAVYEWGSGVVGRYKCFDARVLGAINDALGAKDTIFVLNEPKNSEGTDCNVSCINEGEAFRLRGHAPFDIVFLYGSMGAGQESLGAAFLGPTARETLANTVGMLGWDLRKLQEDRFRPVRNVLYGLRMNYGIPRVEPDAGRPVRDVPVHFHGPFAAVDGGCRCLFSDEIAQRTGVYLWTINVGGQERPWYVGQTRRGFGKRMSEHLAGFLSGEYPTFDASALARGEYQRAAGAVEGIWPQTLPSVLRNYESLMPNIISLIRLIKFHLAPLADDAHLFDRIEGAVGRYYKAHADPELRGFFWPGVRVPMAIPGDEPIRLLLSSEAPVAGLPVEIPA